MASEIKVDTIVNAGGDNDSGIDLATNDAVKIKIANAVKAEVDSSGHVKLDTVKGYTSAASISVVGEGGSTTTNLQQGLVKTWISGGGGSLAIDDSFNVTSVTDSALGQPTIAIANDFASANTGYAITCAHSSMTSGKTGIRFENKSNGSFDLTCVANDTQVDPAFYSAQCTGDLA